MLRTISNGCASRLTEARIDAPAASNVWFRPPAVRQDRFIGTACIFEGIGEDRHRREVAGVVHLLRQREYGGGAPLWLKRDGAKRVAKNVMEQRGVRVYFI